MRNMAKKLKIMSVNLTFDAELSIFLGRKSESCAKQERNGYQQLDMEIAPSSALDRYMLMILQTPPSV